MYLIHQPGKKSTSRQSNWTDKQAEDKKLVRQRFIQPPEDHWRSYEDCVQYYVMLQKAELNWGSGTVSVVVTRHDVNINDME